MFLLVLAHLGSPGQNPESHKMVVDVVVVVVVVVFACSSALYVIEVLIFTDDLNVFFTIAVDHLQTIAYDILWDVKLLLRYGNGF